MTTANTGKPGSAERWGPLWGARPDDWARIEEQEMPNYEEAIRRVGIEPGARVLDVGCGTGTFLRLASERGARVYGLDASASLLGVARARVPEADLRVGDMESLPYEDDFFDLVTGFNSFFFAADMVAALREAGRVAKPGAAIVIQVWGSPERCALDGFKRAVGRLMPAPDPGAPAPPKLWEAGVIEGITHEAGLAPESSFDTRWAFEFPDTDTLVRRNLSPGIVIEAVKIAGEEAVRKAMVEALAPYRTPTGGYRLENEWHFLIARAR